MSVRKAAEQIWKVGDQRVVLADCLPILSSIRSGLIDVVVTSPPYNLDVGYDLHNDRIPRESYLTWLGQRFTELYRALKPDGSFFLNINGSGTADDLLLPRAIADQAFAAGFLPQNEIVWVKAIEVDGVIRGHVKPVNSPRYLTRMFEKILHLTKHGDVSLDKLAIGLEYADKSNLGRHNKSQADPTIDKPDSRDRGNVWVIPYATVQSKTGKFDHPTGFPVELPTWCIKLHGLRPDLVVLDPFAGTGTTLVAAQALGVQGIGIEISRKYAETAVQRLPAAVVS
jgi:site-specific DNA-methyltransferase (adenine-specific)